MAECPEHKGDYFHYRCYKKLKDYYDRDYVNQKGMKFLADYKKSSGDNQNIISKYEDIFKKLTNNLAGDGLMYYDKSITCTYNNYWLNKEVRKENHNVDNNELFEIIKKYADKYSNEKHQNDRNSCKRYIEYIDSEKYQKISKLYELYDLYSKLEIYNNQLNYKLPDSLCITLADLTRNHDAIIKYYEDKDFFKTIDNDLFEKILKIKDLIKNLNLNFYNYCLYYDKLRLHTSNYEIQRKKELEQQELKRQQELAKEQELAREQELAKRQELQPVEQEKEQNSLWSSETTDLGSRLNEVFPEIEVSKDKQVDDIGTTHHAETTGIGELSVTEHSRYSQGRGRLYNSSLYRQEDNFGPSRFPVDSQLNTENPNSEEGIIRSMRNTLFSIVQNVDPVPVVGVSGGMGALFLLFRYTPVGAFFRGGRGRVRRIPSGFHGPFLGEFPGYEEYDGRYVGYSQMNPLAE
ncbi:PIR protein [Plasmodium vivax]|uniref:VIR protein n=1 Tax=Plasmodium vivax TaxID=5855 RepID=A0A565A6I8_PLAVI|nr:PIR protein [Plasmodium vivax]